MHASLPLTVNVTSCLKLLAALTSTVTNCSLELWANVNSSRCSFLPEYSITETYMALGHSPKQHHQRVMCSNISLKTLQTSSSCLGPGFPITGFVLYSTLLRSVALIVPFFAFFPVVITHQVLQKARRNLEVVTPELFALKVLGN